MVSMTAGDTLVRSRCTHLRFVGILAVRKEL